MAGNGEVQVGRAMKSQNVDRLFFPVARAIPGSDGSFQGAVQVGVEVGYIAELLRDLELGPGATLGLYRAGDGAVVARHPMTEAMLNETMAAPPIFSELKKMAQWTGWVQRDGEGQLVSARRMKDAPIIATVSMPKGEVYAGAWSRLPGRALAGMTIWGALFALTALAVRQARREASFRNTLSASEARFREMADHAPVMVWVSEPDGSCSFLSRSWYEFTGQTRETGLDHGWVDAVHCDDRARLEKTIRAVSARRAAGQAEYRLRGHDGAYKWVLAAAAPRFDREGVFLGYIGSVIDISERKEAELALAERNAQLALAGKAARVGGWILDVAQNRIQVTEGYVAIYQLAVGTAEISVDQWRAAVHPDDIKRLDDRRARSFAECQLERRSEYRIVRRDGVVRWIESRGFISYDSAGRPRRMVGVAIDVTERKEAELALAERNAQLALASKAARVGGYLLDVPKNRIQISEGYAAIYQLPPGTTEISLDAWRAMVHGDDVQQLDALRTRSFATHQRERLWRHRIVRRDGQTRWVEARSFVSYDSAGQPQRVIGVNIDVSEQQQAEERQNELIAELDHRVKNVLAKVVALVERTGETCGSLEEFKSIIGGRIRSMANAHELLSRNRWQGVSLADNVRQELAPYATGSNTTVDGPAVILVPEASQAMATVLHELATNAAKYGALSVPEGRVTVWWSFADGAIGPARLVVRWEERGGPPVVPPTRTGFGTRAVRGTVPHQLGGHVDLTFAAAGVSCIIELPLSRIDPGPS